MSRTDRTAGDELLLTTAGAGDGEAFAELVRRHQGWAWKIAYRFLGHRQEAEDVVQDAFLRLLAAARRYQPDSPFRTYFHRIVIRLCLDRAKKKKPLPLETMPEATDPRPASVDELVRLETAAAVRAALAALPEAQRMAVVLRYYDELNYQEIAVTMETTPKAVERLLARGRDGLRKVLRAGTG
ncbi:MAG: sigma-70 family RNA polymerase sigma factor [Thermodesulfobacteriota bacterium]